MLNVGLADIQQAETFFEDFGPVVDTATAAHLMTLRGRPVSPQRVCQLANSGQCKAARLYGKIVVSVDWLLGFEPEGQGGLTNRKGTGRETVVICSRSDGKP